MSHAHGSEEKPPLSAVKDYFRRGDRLGQHLGFELLEVREGYAKVRMAIQPIHLNALEVVHGGTTFALADLAFAAASNACGTVAVAINANITYMKAASKGALVAEAREISTNPKLSNYTVEVRDDAGDLVALFQGLAYRKKERIKA